MYLIITLLLLLPIAECCAGDIQFLEPDGYQIGTYPQVTRVWREDDGSYEGVHCVRLGQTEELTADEATRLYYWARNYLEKQERPVREERERVKREELRRMIQVVQQQIARRRQIDDDIRVWNIMKVGLGCFILMVFLQTVVLLSKERGPRMAGF